MSLSQQATTQGGLVEEVLALVNAARGDAGLGVLTLSEPLNRAAREHSADMATRNYFQYSPPDGQGLSIDHRIVNAGYYGRTGTNLSRGRTDAAEVVEAWLRDGSNRQSLLNPEYRELGLGVSEDLCTLILGAPARLITPELQAEVRSLVNQVRAAAGLPVVEAIPALTYAAQRHSLDMVARRYFGHQGPDGPDTAERVDDSGYEGQTFELLARDVETAESLVAGWVAEDSTKAHLLNPACRHAGVGMAEGRWTLLLGVPARDEVMTSDEIVDQVLALLNQGRASAKVPSLVLAAALNQAAAAHAQDMARGDFFSYEQAGFPGIAAHLKQCSYRGRTMPAITRGQTSAAAVVQLLFGSEGHRRNFLHPDYREVGIAVHASRWTLVLGAPVAEASDELRLQLLRLINTQRAASASPPLGLHTQLAATAQSFAHEMSQRGFFDFQTPEGEPITARARREGYAGQTVPAILRGYTNPESALEAWLKSPQNRANLLDGQFSQLGIGVADSRWVLLLGNQP